MIKCVMKDDTVRYFSLYKVHCIKEAADGSGLRIFFDTPDGRGVSNAPVKSFMLLKPGVSYK